MQDNINEQYYNNILSQTRHITELYIINIQHTVKIFYDKYGKFLQYFNVNF